MIGDDNNGVGSAVGVDVVVDIVVVSDDGV